MMTETEWSDGCDPEYGMDSRLQAMVVNTLHDSDLTVDRALYAQSESVMVEVRLGGGVTATSDRRQPRRLLRDITDRVKLERQLANLELSVEMLSAASNVTRLVREADPLSGVLDRLVS